MSFINKKLVILNKIITRMDYFATVEATEKINPNEILEYDFSILKDKVINTKNCYNHFSIPTAFDFVTFDKPELPISSMVYDTHKFRYTSGLFLHSGQGDFDEYSVSVDEYGKIELPNVSSVWRRYPNILFAVNGLLVNSSINSFVIAKAKDCKKYNDEFFHNEEIATNLSRHDGETYLIIAQNFCEIPYNNENWEGGSFTLEERCMSFDLYLVSVYYQYVIDNGITDILKPNSIRTNIETNKSRYSKIIL